MKMNQMTILMTAIMCGMIPTMTRGMAFEQPVSKADFRIVERQKR